MTANGVGGHLCSWKLTLKSHQQLIAKLSRVLFYYLATFVPRDGLDFNCSLYWDGEERPNTIS